MPRGEAIRNFVYTGCLDDLGKTERLTLLSVIPDEEIKAELERRYGKIYTLTALPEKWIVRILREILDMAHGRWLWSQAARDRWHIRDAEARGVSKKLTRHLKKFAARAFASTAGIEYISALGRVASKVFYPHQSPYFKLFKELKPDLIFNASHVHSEVAVQALEAACWLGIPTAAFIFSWDNLTSQGRIIVPYDYYLVWNESLRDQLLTIYPSVDPKKVFVTGTPQFDFHFRSEFFWTREEFCSRTGADPERSIILYTTGMANHMPGEPGIVEGIARMLEDMTELGPPQLMVRVYPKDRTGRFEILKKNRPDILFPEIPWEPNWLTPKWEDCFLLTNMLRHAAVGINIASTVSLELCMLDKPVINVAYNPPGEPPGVWNYARYYDFEHYRPVVESGAVTLVRSEDEMRGALRSSLKNPMRASEKRKELTWEMFGDKLDGQTHKRVSDILKGILKIA